MFLFLYLVLLLAVAYGIGYVCCEEFMRPRAWAAVIAFLLAAYMGSMSGATLLPLFTCALAFVAVRRGTIAGIRQHMLGHLARDVECETSQDYFNKEN